MQKIIPAANIKNDLYVIEIALHQCFRNHKPYAHQVKIPIFHKIKEQPFKVSGKTITLKVVKTIPLAIYLCNNIIGPPVIKLLALCQKSYSN